MNQKHNNRYPKYFSHKNPNGEGYTSCFIRVYYGPETLHLYDAGTRELSISQIDKLPLSNASTIKDIINESGNYIFTQITKKEFLQLIRQTTVAEQQKPMP